MRLPRTHFVGVVVVVVVELPLDGGWGCNAVMMERENLGVENSTGDLF